MQTFADADLNLDEVSDRWISLRSLDLFGKPVELALSKGAALSVEPAQLRSLNHALKKEEHLRSLVRIFHEARYARREKCSATRHPWRVALSPSVRVGPIVPTQTVGSKFQHYASEFASASMHLLAQTLHVRAVFGLV